MVYFATSVIFIRLGENRRNEKFTTYGLVLEVSTTQVADRYNYTVYTQPNKAKHYDINMYKLNSCPKKMICQCFESKLPVEIRLVIYVKTRFASRASPHVFCKLVSEPGFQSARTRTASSTS